MSIALPARNLKTRGGAVLAIAATGAALVLAPGASSAATAKGPTPVFGGSAYGSTVHLGTLANSGTTAYLPMCTQTAPRTKAIHTAALNLPGVGTIGAVDTQTSASRNKAGSTSSTTSVTAESSLLGGAITLSAVKAVATERHTSAGYTSSTSLSVVGLKIGGVAVPVTNPAPNTKYSLPLGLGSLSLNTVGTYTGYGSHAVSVTGLRITIGSAGNVLGIPAGQIVIGFARASLHDAVYSNATGGAYGTQVNVGNGLVKSGATAPEYLPCGGSTNRILNNATAAVAVPSVLTADAVHSAVLSYDNAGKTTAIATNNLARVNLLGGKVKIGVLTTRAVVSRTAKTLTRAATGTVFGGLTIAGKTYPATPKPNTSFGLPGLGTIYLNRQINIAGGLHVYGLQIVLGTATAGLPAGATITVGSAYATVSAR